MSLEPATEADIPAIMAIERIPDYALFIGSFSEDEHRAYMASPDARYLVWREGGEAVAFVILFKLTDENRIVLAKRIGAAKTDKTRQKRVEQMLSELKEGGVYMGMAHAPSAKARS